MVKRRSAANAADLEAELEWFGNVLDGRLKAYFDQEDSARFEFTSLSPPEFNCSSTSYALFISSNSLDAEERLVLILALIPYIRPQLLDVLWSKNASTDRGFSEFGGVRGNNHGGFLPTAETVLFILACDYLDQRLAVMQFLGGEATLLVEGIVTIAPVATGEPWASGALQISREFVDQISCGTIYRPGYGAEFPAQRIKTTLDWDHLILPATTLEQLEEIRSWILHGQTLLDDWGMRDKLAPGYVSLFYGPSGTGKTFSACLLAKYCDCEVYKVDLSLMVSKYIGETEKNLARVFDAAENRRWILFFDEADALFGKRTKVSNSHDRYANQEVSFLLQRIEEFNGVVVLASNLKSNIDDSFIRRFQSVIHFRMPKSTERLKIWRNAFSEKAQLEKELNLARVADKHEISGGTIMNVVRFASLRAVSRDSLVVLRDDVEEGIRREHLKEGRNL